MRIKTLSATLLLAASLCLVPALGFGEIILGSRVNMEEMGYGSFPSGDEIRAMDLEISLLGLDFKLQRARIDYMMLNPSTFLFVSMSYDWEGTLAKGFFPAGVTDTEGMICLLILDNLDVFADKSGTSLLLEFRKQLRVIYSFIDHIATDMYADVVVEFDSKEGVPLGYFYRGEYHLWEEQPQKEQPQAEKIVYIAETGEKYHKFDCRYLKESSISISLTEAKRQDYTPCKVCNPPQKP